MSCGLPRWEEENAQSGLPLWDRRMACGPGNADASVSGPPECLHRRTRRMSCGLPRWEEENVQSGLPRRDRRMACGPGTAGMIGQARELKR
jgi:hypothetical protein